MSQKNSSTKQMYSKNQGVAQRFAIIGEHTMRWDHVMSLDWRGAVEVIGFSLRSPQEEGGEFLVVIRGFDGEGTPVVGFHSSLTAAEAIAGGAKRISDGTIKWKPDAYRTSEAGGKV